MSTILETIAKRTRERVAELKAVEPVAALERRATRAPRDFTEAFPNGTGTRVIAEVKLASPSEGDIYAEADPLVVATDYLANGAAALSVLTEPHFFKGDLRYLENIRRVHQNAFLLMKDFVVDEYQLTLARAAGADAVLVLLAMLEPAVSRALYRAAVAQGLTPLVEVHDEHELELAASLGARLIGINNRDLKTMTVSLEASERLARLAPRNAVLISESGIREPRDIKRLTEMGYRGFLIGTHFMKTRAPGMALAKLLKGAS